MIKVGSTVRYIKEDTEDDKATGYYPPVGTLGTVKIVDETGYQVKWHKGTKSGAWWCEFTDVEEVDGSNELISDLHMEQQEQM